MDLIYVFRCTGTPENLDGPSLPRTKAYTEMLTECMDLKTLWHDYGIVGEVKVRFIQLGTMD